MTYRPWRPSQLLIVLGLGLLWSPGFAFSGGGELRLTVLDQKTGEPIACRMHLKSGASKPRNQRPFPFWHDHLAFPGKIKLQLPKGQYTFEIERGPEYTDCTGYFTIDDHADDEKTVTLSRAVDMASEGWWSADLNVHRPRRDLNLLMEADDLHIAVVAGALTDESDKPPSNAKSPVFFGEDRFFYLEGYEDTWGDNRLISFVRQGKLDWEQARNVLSPIESLQTAQSKRGAWIDVANAASWDLPVLVALGLVNSVELAGDAMCRSLVRNDNGPGRLRDARQLPPPFGNALWSQQIFYHLLNCGLRITPTAGSGTGAAPNPIGYNRVYAYVGDKLDVDAWWKALAAGQVMVTNGPLIRPHVRGQLPGHVFMAGTGETLSLDISLSLSTRDPIRYLEVIKNGEVERSVPIDEWAKRGGTLEPLEFTESGWFLIRAVTDVETTYRFASTGAYYVEIGEVPQRISRVSGQFFLDWTKKRAANLGSSAAKSADQKYYEQAIRFWEDLLGRANAP